MLLRVHDRFDEGGFADLFHIPEDRTVYKLFRRFSSDSQGKGVHDLFNAETAAFVRAHTHDDLRKHVPAFHGHVKIEAVFEEDGSNLSDRYHLDCCYCLEHLAGKGLKYGWLPDDAKPAAESLVARFEGVGINHVTDADFFGWEDPGSMKVVDIATYDVVASLPQFFMQPKAGA